MEILIIIILILINGVFSMSEIALVSSRKFKLESAAKKGNKNAQKALELANNPNTFLSTVQIGITLIGILTGIFSGESLTIGLRQTIEKVSYLQPYSQSIAVLIIVVVITYFSIVFGELLPKRIGLMFPEKIASLVARPMTFISIITKPFIWLLTKTNDLFLGIFGLKNRKDGIVSEEEIKAMIQESTDGGEIQEIEQDIVERVFALGDRKVREIMTHRSDLIWMDIHDDFETIKNKAGKEIHSVYVIANKDLEDAVGVVSVKELFPLQLNDENFQIGDFIKKPIVVHENMPAYKVLEKFKETKFHYAFVVDEYGSLQGLAAMDDLMDALLGDLAQQNQEEYSIKKRNENSWLADAQVPYYIFRKHFNLIDEEIEGEYNTLGGFILEQLHHVPITGEKLVWKDLEFEIVDMDNMRIDKIIINRL